MQIASLAFATDIGILQLGGSEVVQRDGYIAVRTPHNPTYWWGNFILLPAPPGPHDAERLRSAVRREFPDAAHLAIGIDTTAGEPGAQELLDELGLSVEINHVLTAARLRDAPSPPRPRGQVELRRLADDQDWAQAVELRLAVYEELGSPDERMFTERQLAHSRQLCERGHGGWFGAFIDGRLVASLGVIAARAGVARYQNVETLAEYRRLGLARRLLTDAAGYAIETLDARQLVICADPQYHAIRLYESLGFAFAERQVQLQRPPEPSAASLEPQPQPDP